MEVDILDLSNNYSQNIRRGSHAVIVMQEGDSLRAGTLTSLQSSQFTCCNLGTDYMHVADHTTQLVSGCVAI